MQRTNEREHNYHILKYEKSHINRLQVTFFHSDDPTFEYDLYSFGKKKNEKKKISLSKSPRAKTQIILFIRIVR